MTRVVLEEGTVTRLHNYKIVISNVSWPNTFEEDIKLDRTMLEDEFADQSSKYAYWSTLAALAKDQEARLKRACELVYATSDAAAREEVRQLQAGGSTQKFTEKIYETMAKTNQEYQKIQLEYLDARKLADLLTRAEHAFAQRKEMLISLGAHARTGATDLRVLKEQVRGRIQETKIQQEPEEIVEIVEKTSRRRKPINNK